MSSEQNKRKTHFDKKNYYVKRNRKHFMEAGQLGFLATCNFREKDCVRECYNLLNQYADELYGPEIEERCDKSGVSDEAKNKNDTDGEEEDISTELQNALKKVHSGNQKNLPRRFAQVNTDADNCVFIKTTLANPVELAVKIMRDIEKTKEQKSRYLLRLIPVEVICRANLKDIVDSAGKLFDKYFLKEPKSFSIIVNRRYNNSVSRDDVIQQLAELVAKKNIHNKVDLKGAETSIVVEIMKGLCCLSVAPDYLKLKKYNLMELCGQGQNQTDDKSTTVSKPEETVTQSDKLADGKQNIGNDNVNEVQSITISKPEESVKKSHEKDDGKQAIDSDTIMEVGANVQQPGGMVGDQKTENDIVVPKLGSEVQVNPNEGEVLMSP